MVISVNPALCALTGFDEQELVGTGPPHPVWPPEDETVFRAATAETLSGRVHPHELWLLRKDGKRIPVLITPSLLRDDDGAVVSDSLLFRDLRVRAREDRAMRRLTECGVEELLACRERRLEAAALFGLATVQRTVERPGSRV